MDGIILLDKQVGISTAKAIYQVKKQLNLDKIGHVGTLDPFASGLVVCLCGKATKLAFLFDKEKSYLATSKLYTSSDTLDITGKLVELENIDINEAKLDEAINQIKNTNTQNIPAYSAKKVDGKKLYELSRKNLEVPILSKNIIIHELYRTSNIINNEYSFHASVSKGTFIRQISSDIAKILNTDAILTSLRRTSVDIFNVSQAKNLNELTKNDIIDIVSLFNDLDCVVLSDYLIKLVQNGLILDSRQYQKNMMFWVVDKDNNKIALYTPVEDNKYKNIYLV